MRNKMRGRYLLALTTATAFKVQAVDPEKVLLFSMGPVTLRPQLGISETFTDNVFYNNNAKKADFITTLSPGIVAQIGKKDENYVVFGYTYDHLAYARIRGFDNDNHRIDLRHAVKVNKFGSEGNGVFRRESGILGAGFAFNQGVKVDRDAYLANQTFRYEITEKTSVYSSALATGVDYQSQPALFDQNEITGTVGFELKALPKSSFFGEIYYGQTATDPNSALFPKPPHSSFIGGFLGARGSFTEKLTGTVKAGYESREFSDRTGGVGAPVVEVSVAQKFTERNLLSLTYSRRSRVSVEVAKSAYTADQVSLSFRQKFGAAERLFGDITATYGKFEYEPNPAYASRSDDLILAHLGVGYEFYRWMVLKGAYEFESFHSSIPNAIDYDVNRVIISLAIGY